MDPDWYIFNIHFLQGVPKTHLNSTCNWASNNQYAYLIHQIVLRSFKLRVELTNLNNYLTYFFDGEIFSGLNDTNRIICRL